MESVPPHHKAIVDPDGHHREQQEADGGDNSDNNGGAHGGLLERGGSRDSRPFRRPRKSHLAAAFEAGSEGGAGG